VFLGVDAGEPPPELVGKHGEPGWLVLIERYEQYLVDNGRDRLDLRNDPLRLETATNDFFGDYLRTGPYWTMIGLFIAGKNALVPMRAGFPLEGFLSVPDYKVAHRSGMRAWKAFAAWAKTQGFAFQKPRLWLLESDVP
jgi:hypothetical protein